MRNRYYGFKDGSIHSSELGNDHNTAIQLARELGLSYVLYTPDYPDSGEENKIVWEKNNPQSNKDRYDSECTYLTFSRNNDKSGNPYRLVLVYDHKHTLVKVVRSRVSNPLFVDNLRQSGCKALHDTIHLAVSEFNRLVAKHADLLTNDL